MRYQPPVPLTAQETNAPYLKGRGAQINPGSQFEKIIRDSNPVDWASEDGDWASELRTEFIETKPKTIINKVESEDIPFPWSLNPYQGCEHGCVYCYARNTHPYWGYSAGLDFEQKILVKRDAPALLEKELQKKTWKAAPIMFAGNTDIYQPAERKYQITRACLEVFWKYRHPVSLITKNSLVLRDIDILQKLASERLVQVAISITTLDEALRQFLEPRTASVGRRLKTVEMLTKAGIPVFVMMAPIIPSLNDHEILAMAKTVSDLGALGMGYTMVRLNGDVAVIFEDWLRKTYPDRAEKVLHKIKDLHGGTLHDFRPGKRMRGEGHLAEILRSQFRIAKEKYFKDKKMPDFNLELHAYHKSPQLRLF